MRRLNEYRYEVLPDEQITVGVEYVAAAEPPAYSLDGERSGTLSSGQYLTFPVTRRPGEEHMLSLLFTFSVASPLDARYIVGLSGSADGETFSFSVQPRDRLHDRRITFRVTESTGGWIGLKPPNPWPR